MTDTERLDRLQALGRFRVAAGSGDLRVMSVPNGSDRVGSLRECIDQLSAQTEEPSDEAGRELLKEGR